jgi:hypothetical protein
VRVSAISVDRGELLPGLHKHPLALTSETQGCGRVTSATTDRFIDDPVASLKWITYPKYPPDPFPSDANGRRASDTSESVQNIPETRRWI